MYKFENSPDVFKLSKPNEVTVTVIGEWAQFIKHYDWHPRYYQIIDTIGEKRILKINYIKAKQLEEWFRFNSYNPIKVAFIREDNIEKMEFLG